MSRSSPSTWKTTSKEAKKKLKESWRRSSRKKKLKDVKPLSEKEARKLYPDGALRIAAQGILDKPDGGHRIIHDGTHGVHLNNEIQIEDRLENPGPREMAGIVETSIAAGGTRHLCDQCRYSEGPQKGTREVLGLGGTSLQDFEQIAGGLVE